MRLGGEKDPGGISQFEARSIFLSKLEQLCPDIIEELNNITTEEWAQKYNLNMPWLIEAIKKTRSNSSDGKIYGFAISSEAYWALPEEYINWDPAEETEAEFRYRIEEYITRRHAAAQRAGWKSAVEKRNILHFAWLVHFQVQGWSIPEIAERYNEHYEKQEKTLVEDTVSKGIHQAAKLVGINLRPGKRGPKNPK